MVIFDTKNEAQVRGAYDDLQAARAGGGEQGYGEYRAHLDFMDLAAEQYCFNDHAYRRFTETIKDALDPNGILMPGQARNLAGVDAARALSDDPQAVPFETELWDWEPAERRLTEHLGRECLRLESSTATVAGVELLDGTIEVDLAMGPERGFYGVVWRLQDDENFESFFVRPHQTGNPDAIQYTPVSNDISALAALPR